MTPATFLYVTYIATTPQKVWDALLQGDLCRLYWEGHALAAPAGWKPGSAWHMADTAGTVKCQGEILEFLPAKRLAMSWVKPHDHADPDQYSRLSLDLEPQGKQVRLTITHERLDETMAKGVSFGWPRVLSSLKSFLETGKALDLVPPNGPCSTAA
jgi:uncharacterized protein YndB with AHSA1/START domain